jgi:hypothetical protein
LQITPVAGHGAYIIIGSGCCKSGRAISGESISIPRYKQPSETIYLETGNTIRPYRSASSPLMSRIKPKTHADAKKPSRKCLTINHLEQNPSALLAAAISTVCTSRSLCDPTDCSELQLAWVATFVSSLFYAIQKGASSYLSFL